MYQYVVWQLLFRQSTHMLEIEFSLLSDGRVRVQSRLNPVPQAGNVHGCEYVYGRRRMPVMD